MTNLFLIHWNAYEADILAQDLRTQGFQVQIESADGARAYKEIKADPPDVIVIYLTRLPSHGLQTAIALKENKTTRAIPIIFVDGEGEAVKKTKSKLPEAIFTTSPKLLSVISKSLKGKPE
jgi:DNA-binding response OmpR family regulator